MKAFVIWLIANRSEIKMLPSYLIYCFRNFQFKNNLFQDSPNYPVVRKFCSTIATALARLCLISDLTDHFFQFYHRSSHLIPEEIVRNPKYLTFCQESFAKIEGIRFEIARNVQRKEMDGWAGGNHDLFIFTERSVAPSEAAPKNRRSLVKCE